MDLEDLEVPREDTGGPVWPVGKVRHGENDSTLPAKVRGNQELKGEHSLFSSCEGGGEATEPTIATTTLHSKAAPTGDDCQGSWDSSFPEGILAPDTLGPPSGTASRAGDLGRIGLGRHIR